MWKYFFLLIALGTIVSCSKQSGGEKNTGKLQGLHKYYFPDGQLYLEINYRDSLPHGTFKRYFKKGPLLEQTEYVNGVKHGLSKTFYDNGQLSQETTYDNGRIHGTQIKYRRDGKKAYEAPYYYDNPCVGLKEYFVSGNIVNNYPTIIVKPEDDLLRTNQYVLNIYLSDYSKQVEFYQGELTSNGFIGNSTRVIHTVNGVGRLYYVLPPGAFVMEKINILAKIKTDLRNYYIAQRQYNLAAENK